MQLLFHANTGGLANRLRALAGYKALADLYKTPLRVFWESTPACDANFSELFQSADLILYDRATYFAEKKKAHVFRALAWYSDIWAANAQQLTDKKSFIEASLTFLRSLRPVMSIKDGVESFAADRSLQTCIGVHIRLTDLARSTQAFSSAPGFVPELMSEEEGFWQYIETAINAGEGIFVCTDSKATHERLQAAFGPSLYSLLKSWRSETTPLN